MDYGEKIKIEFLKSKKMSIRQIAKEVNRSKSVVGNYLKDPSTYGVSKRSGGKRVLSPRNLRSILKVASNASISASSIVHEFGLNLSPRTINRARMGVLH